MIVLILCSQDAILANLVRVALVYGVAEDGCKWYKHSAYVHAVSQMRCHHCVAGVCVCGLNSPKETILGTRAVFCEALSA